MSLLLVALLVYLLKEFAVVLQQLLVAVFLAYLIVPIHNWLVHKGISPLLGYGVIALVLLLAAYALGQTIYRSVEHLTANLPVYRDNLNHTVQALIQKTPGVDRRQLERFIAGESDFFDAGMRTMASVAGTFFSFLSQMIVILVYLAFLLAEQSGFGGRIRASFKPESADYILAIIERINTSIGRYLALKTLINAVTGLPDNDRAGAVPRRLCDSLGNPGVSSELHPVSRQRDRHHSARAAEPGAVREFGVVGPGAGYVAGHSQRNWLPG